MDSETKSQRFNAILGLIIFLGIAIFIGVCMIGGGIAVECNGDLSQVASSCTIATSLTLNGTYVVNMNGTTQGDGTIKITGSNIIVDGNGTTLFGNYTNDYYGIRIFANNVTLKNFIVRDFSRGIVLSGANSTVYNISTYHNLNAGIFLSGITVDGNFVESNSVNNSLIGVWIYNGADSNSISNNSLYSNKYNVRIDTSSNFNNVSNNYLWNQSGAFPASISIAINSNFTNILNNTINLSTTPISTDCLSTNMLFNRIYPANDSIYSVFASHANYSVFNNNFVFGKNTTFSVNFYSVYSNNINISNNFLYQSQYQIVLNGSKLYISNNTLSDSDFGSYLRGDGLIFVNNTIKNTSSDLDNYDIGLKFYRVSNANVSYNHFIEMTSAGIGWINSSNLYIFNNTFDFVPLISRNMYKADDKFDIPCVFRGYYTYKSFIGAGLDDSSFSYINMTNFSSSNVYLFNNSYDSDVGCILWDTGNSLVYNDFSNFWFRSFRLPIFYKSFDFYFSNIFNNLSLYSNGILDNNFQINFIGNSNKQLNLSFVKGQYDFYQNLNSSLRNLSINNQTSALFTNGTSICNGSSSNLALNTGQVNITLRPGEECWVLDNDNITYGTVRPYNPFSTSLSKKTLTITNSLTDTVTNIPAHANVLSMGFECKNIKSISGLNNYSCDPTTNELNGNLNLLSGSNYFVITTYSVDQGVCTNIFNGYNSFSPWTVLFAVIGLVVLVSIIGTVVFVVNSYNGETPTSGASLNLDSNLIKVIFIWVLIVAILLILSLVVVGNLCSFS